MTATTVSTEQHKSHRVGWLRAAVLGANDGIVSTASLVVGVAAANTGRSNVLIAGIAGLVSGAISMAAGDELGISEITTARPSRRRSRPPRRFRSARSCHSRPLPSYPSRARSRQSLSSR